jgi:hypothetical protein
MRAVFLSYRRDDSAGHAGRLCEHLNRLLGADRVFMDVQDIAPGLDFAEAIDKTIAGCDAVIAVIGPRWAEELRDRAGQNDFVRHEISAALRRGLRVIPVLVGGAAMPAMKELPAALAPLGLRQAVEIRDARFEEDTRALAAALRPARRRWPVWAAAAVLAAAAGVVYAVRSSPAVDLDGVWVAEMQKPSQRPFRVRLELTTTGGGLSGVVVYPTGDGVIRDGRIEGRSFSFFTAHVPQFESEPVTIRWTGTVEGESIRLTESDPGGVAQGVARK